VGGVGERSGEVAGDLFGVLGAPVVQTTAVQADWRRSGPTSCATPPSPCRTCS
jgi:hypothetical protein